MDGNYSYEISAIAYGDNVKSIFDSFIFIWDEQEGKKVDGQLLLNTGDKLIKEGVDDVIQVGRFDPVGYLVILKDDLRKYFEITRNDGVIRHKVLIIGSKRSFDRGELSIRYYKEGQPEFILNYKDRYYIGVMSNKGEIEYFKQIGGSKVEEIDRYK